MNTLLFLAIVIVIAILVMWLIYYVPLPPGAPAWIKNVIYIVILIVTLVVILVHTGWLGAVR